MKSKTNNPKDIEIIEKLYELDMNEKFIYEYDREKVRKKIENSIREEGREEGEKVGIKKGRQEGKMQEKIGIAINMLKDGLAIETISKYTNLSHKEINSLNF